MPTMMSTMTASTMKCTTTKQAKSLLSIGVVNIKMEALLVGTVGGHQSDPCQRRATMQSTINRQGNMSSMMTGTATL